MRNSTSMNILNVHVNVNAGAPGKVRPITVYATIMKISLLPPNDAPWELPQRPLLSVVLDILNRRANLGSCQVCGGSGSPVNPSTLKYLKPVSQSTVTNRFPAAISSAIRKAAATFAPEEGPTSSPSSRVRRLV